MPIMVLCGGWSDARKETMMNDLFDFNYDNGEKELFDKNQLSMGVVGIKKFEELPPFNYEHANIVERIRRMVDESPYGTSVSRLKVVDNYFCRDGIKDYDGKCYGFLIYAKIDNRVSHEFAMSMVEKLHAIDLSRISAIRIRSGVAITAISEFTTKDGEPDAALYYRSVFGAHSEYSCVPKEWVSHLGYILDGGGTPYGFHRRDEFFNERKHGIVIYSDAATVEIKEVEKMISAALNARITSVSPSIEGTSFFKYEMRSDGLDDRYVHSLKLGAVSEIIGADWCEFANTHDGRPICLAYGRT